MSPILKTDFFNFARLYDFWVDVNRLFLVLVPTASCYHHHHHHHYYHYLHHRHRHRHQHLHIRQYHLTSLEQFTLDKTRHKIRPIHNWENPELWLLRLFYVSWVYKIDCAFSEIALFRGLILFSQNVTLDKKHKCHAPNHLSCYQNSDRTTNIFGTEENMKTCRRGGFDSHNEILN